jgi:hypothetical protein
MSIADRARVKGIPREGALRDLMVTAPIVRRTIADDCVRVIWRSRT